MEEAARARRRTIEAVSDIEPAPLLELIEDLLRTHSMTPGALAVYWTDESVGEGSVGAEQRAAGVQLIYEGLRLTRDLVAAEPWEDPERRPEGNLRVLAADVMVARGFYLLARTPAADKAVETVRQFGREQATEHPEPGTLEADILELAVMAATESPPESERAKARTVGSSIEAGMPAPEQLIAEFEDRQPDVATNDGIQAPDD